jgi:hypothetical protein
MVQYRQKTDWASYTLTRTPSQQSVTYVSAMAIVVATF